MCAAPATVDQRHSMSGKLSLSTTVLAIVRSLELSILAWEGEDGFAGQPGYRPEQVKMSESVIFCSASQSAAVNLSAFSIQSSPREGRLVACLSRFIMKSSTLRFAFFPQSLTASLRWTLRRGTLQLQLTQLQLFDR